MTVLTVISVPAASYRLDFSSTRNPSIHVTSERSVVLTLKLLFKPPHLISSICIRTSPGAANLCLRYPSATAWPFTPHPSQTSLAPSLGWHRHPGQERKAQPLSPSPRAFEGLGPGAPCVTASALWGLPLGVVVSQKSSACWMLHLSGLTLPVFSECLAIVGCTLPATPPREVVLSPPE